MPEPVVSKRPPQSDGLESISPGNSLAKGATGETVRALQRSLNKLGYDVKVDGIFGDETEKWVKDFQQGTGLKDVDGKVGVKTVAQIREEIAYINQLAKLNNLKTPQPQNSKVSPELKQLVLPKGDKFQNPKLQTIPLEERKIHDFLNPKDHFLGMVRRVIACNEGINFSKYNCTSNCASIGVGHNMEPDLKAGGERAAAARQMIANGISMEKVEELFNHDLQKVQKDLRAIFPNFDRLDDARKIALIDFRFNLGGGKFKTETEPGSGIRGFKNMIAAVNAGDFERAATEMQFKRAGSTELSKWYQQVKERGPRIVAMMRTGAFTEPPAPKITD